jgi:hypothetical protein
MGEKMVKYSYSMPSSRMGSVEQAAAVLKEKTRAVRKAPFTAIKKRWAEFKKNPSLQTFWDAFKSVLLLNALKDYKEARQTRQAALGIFASAILAECSRNEAFREEIKRCTGEGRKFLTMDKSGKPFFSSWSGRVIQPPKGDAHYSANLRVDGNRKAGYRIDMEAALKQTLPFFEKIKAGNSEVVARLIGRELFIYKEGKIGRGAKPAKSVKVNLGDVKAYDFTIIPGRTPRDPATYAVEFTDRKGGKRRLTFSKELWGKIKKVIDEAKK